MNDLGAQPARIILTGPIVLSFSRCFYNPTECLFDFFSQRLSRLASISSTVVKHRSILPNLPPLMFNSSSSKSAPLQNINRHPAFLLAISHNRVSIQNQTDGHARFYSRHLATHYKYTVPVCRRLPYQVQPADRCKSLLLHSLLVN